MNFRPKSLLATALITLSAIACAASEPSVTPVNLFSTKPGAHFVLNAGLTYGGDTIYAVTYTNGSTKNIKAGSLMHVGLGGLYQFNDNPIAVKLSANLHIDQAAGSNGEVYFIRSPFELLAYYTGKEKLRIGGGIRVIKYPEASATINGAIDRITFNDTTGLVAEVGFQVAPHAWLNVRGVSEKYQAKDRTVGGVTYSVVGTSPYNGSHIGVNFSYEF